jgi:hypothetical protein
MYLARRLLLAQARVLQWESGSQLVLLLEELLHQLVFAPQVQILELLACLTGLQLELH